MLKLSGYELRKNMNMLLIILGGLALLEICFCVSLQGENEKYTVMWIALLMMYAVVCFFSVFLFAISNYYREINSKTSYLVFMTPTDPLRVILSKMLTVLVIGTMLAAALGILGFADRVMLFYKYNEYGTLAERISELLMSFGINTSQIFMQLVLMVVRFLLYVFSTVSLLYLCITLAATLLQNARLKLVVTVIFFGLSIWLHGWMQVKLGELLPTPLMTDGTETFTVSMGTVLEQSWPYALSDLAVLCVCTALTTWLLNKKLSL